MSISFDVNKKALQTLGKEVLSTLNIKAAFEERTKEGVEACGANHPSVAKMLPLNGLMGAIDMCYDEHYPLVLTPDTIWLTIAQGFAQHVNLNAEKLRKRFVSHEGKKLILIQRNDFAKGSPNNDWQSCFSQFSEKLAGYIGKKRDLIVSDFSTTGPVEKAASELVLMDSMKSYFKYGVMTLCGIPNITLTGTVEDWENIRTRVENLAEYELDWWIDSLHPVMDHFVKAAQGNADIKFWDEMYKLSNGSGGPYCQGWVNTLFPYLQDYKSNIVKNEFAEGWNNKRGFSHGPKMNQFLGSLSKTPFKWELFETTTYDMEFLGGIVGSYQDPKTLAIEPTIGWAIRDTGVSKPGKIDPDEDW